MIDPQLAEKVLTASLKQGGDFSELFVEETLPTTIALEDNKIEKITTGKDTGAGLRLVHSGKTAYGFTNDLTEPSLLKLASHVRSAVENEHGSRGISITGEHTGRGLEIKIPFRSRPISEKLSLIKDANNVARKFDSRIRQVIVMYRDYEQNIMIALSDGTIIKDQRNEIVFVVQAIASDNGIIQTGYEPVGGFTGFELFHNISPEEVAKTAARRAVTMLQSRKAPAGKMPVVISSEAGGTMIHEAVGHGLEADFTHQGLSVYSGKIGEKIASPLITVIDDATLSGKRGSFNYDDEGTPSQRTVLVEQGILKNYMYDRLTAKKDGKDSTGNGRRESFRNRPIPRMTNTFIAPGDSSPDEIISSTGKGLFVKKMGGGEVNIVNGDFVFEVSEGYLIEKGKICEPVRGATLIGNGPEVLNQIDMVGNDLGFGIGTCGKDGQGVPVSDAQPTLRIPSITVGGHK